MALNRSRWFKWLRRTPLHPQWLLGNSGATIDWVGANAYGKVLDIGCADRWIQLYLPKGCDYIALDYPPTGGEMYGARPDVFGDAAKLPFADACIDTILLLEVMEHLRHPAQALSEIARVLKPGGQLLLTIPFLYPVHDAPHDYQRYTCYGLAREIEAAGLEPGVVEPSLGTAESGALVFALALGGMASEAVARRSLALLLLPVLALMILCTNLSSWLLGRVMPHWPALTAGYRVRVVRQ